ncbi:hypothetical protein [Vibrio ouci]|uniref:DMT family transporter n=1 Tax=Vibrio ouci TaxID=2499078 RepID=A0A4Y8W9A7_9VIBR|nr:hypothetical protein [Vibrio ouci]TFH89417.1 hypothetical protein ELS82_22355 [Vibrio ouci]
MLGLGLIVASVALQAFALSRVSFQLGNQEIMAFSSMSFFLCSFVFFCKLIVSKPLVIDRVKVIALAKMNVYTLLAFLAFHLALMYLPASSAALIEASIALVVVSILTRESLTRLLQAVAIVMVTLAFAFHTNDMDQPFIVGLLLSGVAGIGAAVISFKSHSDNMGYLSVDEMLAFRFLLSGAIATLLVISTDSDVAYNIDYGNILPLSLFGFVLPFYLLQKGMEVTRPILTVCMLSIIPATSYLFESILYRHASVIESGLMGLAVLLILTYSTSNRVRQTSNTLNRQSSE